ncbi:hypothetical protein FTV88_1999 [Heliorestis convoluta]|uniref:Uncharacterized protein n=1 Tax=Heliorestis convoluta TaxID=356322 RepID=A0A5Q2MZI7_9FIRM|nr:hypothetical protein FTV88_1999 [Heliorestis convoluta]
MVIFPIFPPPLFHYLLMVDINIRHLPQKILSHPIIDLVKKSQT